MRYQRKIVRPFRISSTLGARLYRVRINPTRNRIPIRTSIPIFAVEQLEIEREPVGKLVQFLRELFRYAARLPGHLLPTEAVPKEHHHQEERRQRS